MWVMVLVVVVAVTGRGDGERYRCRRVGTFSEEEVHFVQDLHVEDNMT